MPHRFDSRTGWRVASRVVRVRATFVRWNPVTDPPSGALIAEAAAETQFSANRLEPRSPYLSNWTVRVHGETIAGDLIYMALWDDKIGFIGLQGRGRVVGPEYSPAAWRADDPGAVLYLPIIWDYMLPLGAEIGAKKVTKLLPGREWPLLQSGEILPGNVAAPLNELWKQVESDAARAAQTRSAAKAKSRRSRHLLPWSRRR